MELTDIIVPYIGKPIKEGKKTADTLTLVFEKKILFIKKEVKIVIYALEDISSLSIKGIEKDVIDAVSFENGRIKFSLRRDDTKAKYSFSFKANKVTRN